MLAKPRFLDTRLMKFLPQRRISLKAKELNGLSEAISRYIERSAFAQEKENLTSEITEFVFANGQKLKGINPNDAEAMAAFKAISSNVRS